jgi:LPXTG-site transpeptidase (sortase) family protein
MTKRLKYFIALLLVVFSVSYLVGTKSITVAKADEDHHDHENCNYSCPVIHFKNFDVNYDMSDNHKCHRPSDDTLKHTYHLNDGDIGYFKQHNDEWKDGIQNHCPTPSPTQTPVISPENSPTPTIDPCADNACVTPSVEPTPTSAPSNNSGNNGGGSQPGPYVCNDTDPGAPTNLQAFALGGGKVKLTWNNAPGPHTSYAVAYGPSIGNYLYGDPNVGNVTTYTVLALNPGGKYCFYVQAQNGCKGGVPSNVVCSNQGAGSLQVLGTSTNYNPLVEGIKDSFGGEVLGAATMLARTAEVVHSSDKLPSGNTPVPGYTISIPSLNLNGQQIYLPQNIGNELTVGSHEVLSATLNGAQLYYGHNATDVFGTLFEIKTGAKISVTSNGQTQNYTVAQTDFVSQNNVAAVKADVPGEIVLMTCSFTQPDHRILVKAIPSL